MGNEKFRLLLVSTGGTIEKTYDEQEGSLVNRETTIREKILKRLRLPHHDISVHSLLAKDSLYMTMEDRKLIAECIQKQQEHYQGIAVLHGTDTMDQTLNYCQQVMTPSIPVVFTGAMKPLGFDDSDALQNVIEALYAVRLSQPGFYLSFHGTLFQPPVVKNRENKTFEHLEV